MTTLPNMGLTLPVRGDAGAGEWGDTWDEGATKIDAHDHTSGKGARVPTAGISINADLPFGAAYAPTQLHRVQFSAIAGGALTGSNNRSLFVSDGTSGLVNNELYFRNASGNNVQLTSGNTINLSVAGAIGGDYATVGAQLNYDDSGKRYTLKEGISDSNGWARIAAGDLRLYPFGGAGTFYVGLAAPGGIAASYTATWPATLPGTTTPLQISSTGAISASNTFVNAITCSTSLALSGSATLTVGTGATTLGGALSVTGATTAAAISTSGGVTYTGSAEEHHPSRTIMIDCSEFHHKNGVTTGLNEIAFGGSVTMVLHAFKVEDGSGNGALLASLDGLRAGDRITTIEVCLARASNPDGSEVVILETSSNTTSADVPTYTSGTLTRPSANSVGTASVSPNVTLSSSSESLRLRIKTTNTATGGTLYLRWVRVTYDRP